MLETSLRTVLQMPNPVNGSALNSRSAPFSPKANFNFHLRQKSSPVGRLVEAENTPNPHHLPHDRHHRREPLENKFNLVFLATIVQPRVRCGGGVAPDYMDRLPQQLGPPFLAQVGENPTGVRGKNTQIIYTQKKFTHQNKG